MPTMQLAAMALAAALAGVAAPAPPSAVATPSQAGVSSAPSVPSPAEPPAAASIEFLPANTVIELETVQAVSSRTSRPGERFALRVREPLRVGDETWIPAGTPAQGQVIHAQKSGAGGRPGELIVAARSVDAPGGPVKLRSSFGQAGADRNNAALATSIAVGVFGLLVKGKDTELPAGTALSARLAEPMPRPAPSGAAVAPSAPPSIEPPTKD